MARRFVLLWIAWGAVMLGFAQGWLGFLPEAPVTADGSGALAAGWDRLQQGQYARAVDDLRRAARAIGETGAVLIGLGEAYFLLDEGERAEALLVAGVRRRRGELVAPASGSPGTRRDLRRAARVGERYPGETLALVPLSFEAPALGGVRAMRFRERFAPGLAASLDRAAAARGALSPWGDTDRLLCLGYYYLGHIQVRRALLASRAESARRARSQANWRTLATRLVGGRVPPPPERLALFWAGETPAARRSWERARCEFVRAVTADATFGPARQALEALALMAGGAPAP